MSNVVKLIPRTDATTAPERPGSPAPVARAVYTVKEVAHMLSLNLGGTYNLIRSGDIPAIKLGGRWVVPRGRFHTWLDNLPDATPEDIAATFTPVELAELDTAERALIERFRHGA